MSVDILGTSWDQCRSMVQYSFTSTETRRLVRTDSPGRPPRLSHNSWTMTTGSVLGWLHIAWAGPSLAWTGLCRGCPRHRLPQPPFVLSFGIFPTRLMQIVSNPIQTRCSILPASSKGFVEFYHWRELPQVPFLSRQTFCRNKRVFVATNTGLVHLSND